MKHVIHPAYSDFTEYIIGLPERFSRKEGRMVYDGRNQVMAFEHKGCCFMVKRFKDAHFIQRLVYTFFRKTKAERAYRFAGMLRSRGIDTPHEVAYLEIKRAALFVTGYFVCLPCDNPPAFAALVSPPAFDKEMAADLAAFVVTMHQKGILFGDLNLSNFLYEKGGDGHVHFTLVDTNRSHFREGIPPRDECLKNLQTLTHRRDLFRFLHREYARVRGWDERETVRDAFRYLFLFEKRHDRKRRWQKQMRRKKCG